MQGILLLLYYIYCMYSDSVRTIHTLAYSALRWGHFSCFCSIKKCGRDGCLVIYEGKFPHIMSGMDNWA